EISEHFQAPRLYSFGTGAIKGLIPFFDQSDIKSSTRQIDRKGRACWTSADNEHIKNVFANHKFNSSLGKRGIRCTLG
ncbi:TPA: hypothetical protein ACUNF5_007545, partial [Burkholderia orbicola]